MSGIVVTARELMARTYTPPANFAAACVQHVHLALLERPADCRVCLQDLRNELSRVRLLLDWMNRWRDDALEVLAREDDAIMLLLGWEARDAGDGTCTLTRPPNELLCAGLPPEAATTMEAFLNRVVERADGIDTDPPVTVVKEGEADGAR